MKFLRHTSIKLFIVPFVLVCYGIVNTLFLASPISLTIVSEKESLQNISVPANERILEGSEVKGFFQANNNNLGIISIPFSIDQSVDYKQEDELLFQLVDVKTKKIVHESTYRSGHILSSEYFPFGIDPIVDSKDKEYMYRIRSLKGNNRNALTFETDKGILLNYNVSKQEFLKNPITILTFLMKKIEYIASDIQLLLNALSFFLPFVYYIIFFIIATRNNMTFYKPEIFTCLLIVIDIFFITLFGNATLISILSVWIVLHIRYKHDSSISLAVSFICFIIALVAQTFGYAIPAQKAGVWGYFMLLIAIIQFTIDIQYKNKKRLTLVKFIKSIKNK